MMGKDVQMDASQVQIHNGNANEMEHLVFVNQNVGIVFKLQMKYATQEIKKDARNA